MNTQKIALVILSLSICTQASYAANLNTFSRADVGTKTSQSYSLSNNQKIGVGAVAAAIVVGLGLWWSCRETADDIPGYLVKVENDLIQVEAHAYVRAWANGPDWQAWMCNLVVSQPNAAGIKTILTDLQELKETLQLPLLARAHKLAINNNVSIDRCMAYKVRAERLRASVDEMIRMAEPIYTQRYTAERLEAAYADYRTRLQNVASNELLMNVYDVRGCAQRVFATSNWPYADAVCSLQTYKDRLNSLLREINAAPYHVDQQMLFSQGTQLRDSVLWAINELQNAPEYAQQMRLKRISEEQRAERARLDAERRRMDEELRRRNEELKQEKERQQRELDELRRRERQQARPLPQNERAN